MLKLHIHPFILKMSKKKQSNLLRDLFARVERRQRLQDMNSNANNAEVTNAESITANDSSPASLIHNGNQAQQEQENVNKSIITPSNTQITRIGTSIDLDYHFPKNVSFILHIFSF